MPRVRKDSGKDFFLRSNSGVMANWRDNVVLSSKNLISNPDLKDISPDNSAEGWTLAAPDRPDGWNVYLRQISRTGQGNIRDRTTPEKQNYDTLNFNEGQFLCDEAVDYGKPVTDENKRAKIAPPDDIKVKVKNTTDVGYRAGTYWVSYAYIVGPEGPHRSSRVSNTAPAVQVTLTAGQYLDVYLPEAPGEGVVGYAIYMSSRNGSAGTLYEQTRVDVRNKNPEKVRLRGPLKENARLLNSPTGTNYTKLGANLPAPRINFVVSPWHSDCDIKKRVSVAYRVLTKEGWSQISTKNSIKPGNHPNKALKWGPSRFPNGAVAWLPLFFAEDGKLYTLSGGGYSEDGIPLKKDAMIPNFNPGKKDSWPHTKIDAVESDLSRSTADKSGIEGPTEPLDDPVPVGQTHLTPGKYRVYTTFSVGDEESAPSPYADVTLAETSSGSGLTTQSILVYRPKIQKITNEVFSATDQNGILLDWSEPDLHGTTVTFGNGKLTVNDTTAATTNQAIRMSDTTPITPSRRYTVTGHLKCTRYTGGIAQVVLHLYNSSGTQVDSAIVGKVKALNEEDWFTVSFSNDRTKSPDLRIPSTVASAAISIRSVGNVFGARNLDFYADNLGLFVGGRAMKRVGGDFGLMNDAENPDKLSPAIPDSSDPYPSGAFCRLVDSPTDGPRVLSPTILGQDQFNGGVRNGAFGVTTTAGTQTVETGAGVNGEYGLSIVSGSAGANYTNFTFSARARAACYWYARYHTSPASNMTIASAYAGSTQLAWAVLNTDGQIVLNAANGAGTSTVNTGWYIYRGQPNRYELEVNGANTSSATVTLTIRRYGLGDRQFTLSSMNMTGKGQLTEYRVGQVAGGGSDMDVDDIAITADGLGDTDPLATNYVEYWAPDGQPYIFQNFMYGMRVPVKPNTNYTFSAYVGSEGITRTTPADLFVTAFTDEDGNILQTNDPLCTLTGDNYWSRRSITFLSPDNAVYLKFIGGNVADGLIRAAAFQIETGTTMTSWDATNGTTGYFDVYFDTRVPGTPIASIVDKVIDYVNANAIATHVLDVSENEITSIGVQYRGADDLTALSAATYQSTLAAAVTQSPRYVELRVTLNTTNTLYSPEVNGAFLQTKRALPMLYKHDGRDFKGGALVRNLPPISKERNIVPRQYADGTNGFVEVGRGRPTKWLHGFEIEVNNDDAVADITDSIGKDTGEFIIEARGKRYHILFTDAKFTTQRQDKKPLVSAAALADRTYLYRHIAQGVEAEVVAETDL